MAEDGPRQPRTHVKSGSPAGHGRFGSNWTPASARPQRVIVDRLALEEAVKLSWQKRDGKGREVADQGSDTECDDGIESRFLAQPRWLAGTPEAGVMLGV